MLLAPVLNPLHIILVAKVFKVLRFLEPQMLAGSLAGLATHLLAAILLTLPIAKVRMEFLVALQTLRLFA